MVRLARSSSDVVQRELRRRSGLVTKARVGAIRQTYDRRCCQNGLAGPLRGALAPHAERIAAAFVYGSLAKGEETAGSDIDLMVIGDDVTYSDFFDGFLQAEQLLHRRIHANFVSPHEWKRKLAEGIAFFTKINAQPKIFVVGSPEDLPA